MTNKTEVLEVDYFEVIKQTDGYMACLGWSKQDAIGYLLKTYGKRSRYSLPDNQLIEFRDYLKGLALGKEAGLAPVKKSRFKQRLRAAIGGHSNNLSLNLSLRNKG